MFHNTEGWSKSSSVPSFKNAVEHHALPKIGQSSRPFFLNSTDAEDTTVPAGSPLASALNSRESETLKPYCSPAAGKAFCGLSPACRHAGAGHWMVWRVSLIPGCIQFKIVG